MNSPSLAALPELPTDADWAAFLAGVAAEFDCLTGTLHRLDAGDGELKLVASLRVPPSLIPVIQSIPVGKGIAGAAAERQAPVELCNLQTDTSGVAREGAKVTQVMGSLAVPAMDGARLCGTLGIGKVVPYDFTEDEKDLLMAIGSAVAAKLA